MMRGVGVRTTWTLKPGCYKFCVRVRAASDRQGMDVVI